MNSTVNSDRQSTVQQHDRGKSPRDFQLLKEIGRGGMGVVYTARQLSLNRHVAIKFLNMDKSESDEGYRRFIREAESVARLRHANIVTVYTAGVHRQRPYFAMEWIRGENLKQRIDGRPLDAETAVSIFKQVLDGIFFAHTNGVIHRDLKPHNVLIDQEGNAKIVDFGLARKVDQNTELTADNAILGSGGYMAPEQVDPTFGPISVRTDIYGLGATLYEMLCGRPPHKGQTPAQLMVSVIAGEIQPVGELNGGISPALEAICMKCLARKPADRFESVEQLQSALQEMNTLTETLPVKVNRKGRTRWIARSAFIGTGVALGVMLTLGFQSLRAEFNQIIAKYNTPSAKTADTEVRTTPATNSNPDEPPLFEAARLNYSSGVRGEHPIEVRITNGNETQSFYVRYHSGSSITMKYPTMKVAVYYNEKLVVPEKSFKLESFGRYRLSFDRKGDDFSINFGPT